MNEPKLRFKADDGSEFPDWEEKKVVNLFSKIKEKNKDGKIQNVITNSAEFGLINQRDFFDKDIAIDGKTENYTIIKTGDFVYNPRKSRQAPYGPFNCYQLKEDGIVSPLYTCLRPKGIANAEYLLWYFQSGAWYRFIYENGAQNGARHDRVGMTDSLMQDIPVYVPRLLEEQQKIADFLSTIDTVIEKQKATVEAWEERKKGVMQKLFSQEVRFKADDGSEFPDWEEKKYLSVCDVFTDGDWIESKDQSDSGIRLIQTGNIGNGIFIDKEDRKKYISKETFEKLKCKEVFEGDILISRLPSPAGRACVVPKLNERMITAVDCTIIRTNKNIITHSYCVQFMQSSKHFYYVASMMAGGTRQRISRKNLEDESIFIPCLAEQQKIADCLSALDDVIEKQKATLAAWEEMKKGLLQQMFV